MTERWLPVVGFEGSYEVSDQGRVRSVTRTIAIAGRWGAENRTYAGKIMTPQKAPGQPYLRVVLTVNSAKTCRTVHSLVADAFLGPCPIGQECRHRSCDGSDNSLGNLLYGTRSENREDSRVAGTLAVGERIAQHKITAQQAAEIRAASGHHETIAARYDISRTQVSRIKRRENWRHV